ncbi:MAG: [Fe-Fe] hydrogenase large subunit C-terminal domain-containing protein, partial [Sporomusaceae bacterium]|nr:[Fe-Fe] hydrogenase large subunit C-terminal domain-containing protein [Sporomusaceae bacterium]
MTLITTEQVNCQDCHRCVRSCPVKAIGIEKSHAKVWDERCISCGRCVVECPQQAKQVENQVDAIKKALHNGEYMVLSLAPSFVAAFPEYSLEQLLLRLHALGFSVIEEASIGAEIVSNHYSRLLEKATKPVISACCPVIVNMITHYHPSLVDCLAPVVSPMVAHGLLLQQKYGPKAQIVFAGPCIAKLEEQKESKAIHYALTFVQLKEWLSEVKAGALFSDKPVELNGLAYEKARYFPLSGGILKSFLTHDEMDLEILSIDGVQQCSEAFKAMEAGEIAPRFVEALACRGGCINGPASGTTLSLAARKARVVEYAKKGSRQHIIYEEQLYDFTRKHEARPIIQKMPDSYEIKKILQQTGKYSRRDEKNCGACGYNSCRDKAIAVYQGMAEVEMCVPYMRAKAESFANIIVDNSLHGILVMNENCVLQQWNPAAEELFGTLIPLAVGLNLATVMDCSAFQEAWHTANKIMARRIEYAHLALVTEQMILPVPKHGLIIAIISDVSVAERKQQELADLREDTVQKASEIIKKQMHVAQEIAGLLG